MPASLRRRELLALLAAGGASAGLRASIAARRAVWLRELALDGADAVVQPGLQRICSCADDDPMRFASIVNSDGSPRPAFTALTQMVKPIR